MPMRALAENREILAYSAPVYTTGSNLMHTIICATRRCTPPDSIAFCRGGRVARHLLFFSRHGCLYKSFSSFFVFAKGFKADFKISPECAALSWTRTRAVPCGATG